MRKRSEIKAKASADPKTPADELASKLQSGTTVFSVAIRSLKSDYDRGSNTYSPASRFLAERLINIPSVHAPLHFAVQTFFSEKHANRQFITTTELTQIFPPLDMATLFGALYLYRRLKKLSPAEEWGFISRFVTEQTEIAGHLGATIPDIGIASAIVCGGIRAMAFATFALKDVKKFKEYRRHLRTHPTLYDRDYERAAWQCDHLDIATLIVQRLGLGSELARAFFDAISETVLSEDEVTGQFSRFQASADFLEALSKSESPSRDDFGDGSLDEKAITHLLDEVRAIKKGGSQYLWLDKGKADYIGPEGKAAEATLGDEAHLDDFDTIQDISLDEVPDEIKQEIEQQIE